MVYNDDISSATADFADGALVMKCSFVKQCQYNLVGDLNGDCRVDVNDFAWMAGNFLVDCNNDPGDPNEPPCVLK